MTEVKGGVSGFMRQARLDEGIIKEIVGGMQGSKKAVCSGPVGFNSMVADSLYAMDWMANEIVLLGETQPLSLELKFNRM
jgi:hypothetical protein